eukprot:gene13062-biopygen11636
MTFFSIAGNIENVSAPPARPVPAHVPRHGGQPRDEREVPPVGDALPAGGRGGVRGHGARGRRDAPAPPPAQDPDGKGHRLL